MIPRSVNWWPAENPFNLVAPPQWVLTRLAIRDADLVLLPGKAEAVYRVARRITRSHGLITAALGHDSETARLIKLRLEPVTSILPFTTWIELFSWLDAHDVWDAGGADGAVAVMDQGVEARDARRTKARLDEAEQRAAAGYRAMKFRSGQTIFLPGHDLTSHMSPAGMGMSPVNAGTGA